MMQNEQLDKFSFVLDNRQTDEWIGLRRAQQRRRKHDGHVLGAHHVLLLVLRHSVVDTYTNDVYKHLTLNILVPISPNESQ